MAQAAGPLRPKPVPIVTMIYVFANERYGRPFITAARAFASRERKRVTIVFSSRKLGSRRGRLRSLSVIRWAVRTSPVLLPLLLDRRVAVALVGDVNDQRFVDRVKDEDIGVVCGFNQIFEKDTIRRFGRLVNIHPSLLPLYRGPIPSYWCLANGEAATGFTIHDVTVAIDEGPILAQEIVGIEPTDTPDSLDLRIAKAAAGLLGRLLGQLNGGEPIPAGNVDPYSVYRRHVGYASWPSRKAGLG